MAGTGSPAGIDGRRGGQTRRPLMRRARHRQRCCSPLAQGAARAVCFDQRERLNGQLALLRRRVLEQRQQHVRRPRPAGRPGPAGCRAVRRPAHWRGRQQAAAPALAKVVVRAGSRAARRDICSSNASCSDGSSPSTRLAWRRRGGAAGDFGERRATSSGSSLGGPMVPQRFRSSRPSRASATTCGGTPKRSPSSARCSTRRADAAQGRVRSARR